MHIGMIVGIGPAATDYYYRKLIALMAEAGQDLELTMAHADTKTLLQHQATGNVRAQVEIYSRLTERLAHAGVEQVAVTSIAGHFCIDAFKAVSPIPVIDLLDVMRQEVRTRGLKRIGLMGTKVVMASRFYGIFDETEVLAPQNIDQVHEAYVDMASKGRATDQHKAVFIDAGRTLVETHGCETILLAGTDLALVFNHNDVADFAILDCAERHAHAIATCAMASKAI